jgi:hypothetical protein
MQKKIKIIISTIFWIEIKIKLFLFLQFYKKRILIQKYCIEKVKIIAAMKNNVQGFVRFYK